MVSHGAPIAYKALKKKSKVGGLTVPNLKTYYRAKINKAKWTGVRTVTYTHGTELRV